MHRFAILIAACSGAVASPALAEVVSADAHGFEIRHQVQLVVPPATAYAAFGEVGGWWGASHSYSGDAANLRLSLSPGGCFCERLPGGGGVEHLRVTYVEPGKRVVLTGALGPLLFEAVSGVMLVEIERIAGGSRVKLNYRAAGFAKGGAETLAPAVDQVLAEQMKRYRAYATARSRTR